MEVCLVRDVLYDVMYLSQAYPIAEGATARRSRN